MKTSKYISFLFVFDFLASKWGTLYILSLVVVLQVDAVGGSVGRGRGRGRGRLHRRCRRDGCLSLHGPPGAPRRGGGSGGVGGGVNVGGRHRVDDTHGGPGGVGLAEFFDSPHQSLHGDNKTGDEHEGEKGDFHFLFFCFFFFCYFFVCFL